MRLRVLAVRDDTIEGEGVKGTQDLSVLTLTTLCEFTIISKKFLKKYRYLYFFKFFKKQIPKAPFPLVQK